jgi:hypothetical protein
MDLSQAAPPTPSQSYRPHRGWMFTAIIGIGWVIPSSLLMTLLATRIYHYGDGDTIMRMFRLQAAGGLTSFITFIIGAIGFLYWLRGAYRNLQPLGSTKTEISPGVPATGRDAVVSFLIPVVNLFRARRVLVHLWRESQPAPAVLDDGTVLVGTTRLVNWWYATWLLHYFPVTILFIVVPYSSMLTVTSFFGVLRWVAALLCCVMVWTIEKRQAEQFHDLQLRQPAPPVTDQLR